MDPNTSCTWPKGLGLGKLEYLAGLSLQRQGWCFSAELKGNDCDMLLTQGWMNVSHICSSPPSPSDNLLVCLSCYLSLNSFQTGWLLSF